MSVSSISRWPTSGYPRWPDPGSLTCRARRGRSASPVVNGAKHSGGPAGPDHRQLHAPRDESCPDRQARPSAAYGPRTLSNP